MRKSLNKQQTALNSYSRTIVIKESTNETSEVLTAVVESSIFWNGTLCSPSLGSRLLVLPNRRLSFIDYTVPYLTRYWLSLLFCIYLFICSVPLLFIETHSPLHRHTQVGPHPFVCLFSVSLLHHSKKTIWDHAQVLQRVRGRLDHVGEQVASCPLGQILIRGADRLLWTVEASVQWFVESKEPEKTSSSKKGSRGNFLTLDRRPMVLYVSGYWIKRGATGYTAAYRRANAWHNLQINCSPHVTERLSHTWLDFLKVA